MYRNGLSDPLWITRYRDHLIRLTRSFYEIGSCEAQILGPRELGTGKRTEMTSFSLSLTPLALHVICFTQPSLDQSFRLREFHLATGTERTLQIRDSALKYSHHVGSTDRKRI